MDIYRDNIGELPRVFLTPVQAEAVYQEVIQIINTSSLHVGTHEATRKACQRLQLTFSDQLVARVRRRMAQDNPSAYIS